MNRILEHFLLLPLGVLVGLTWANTFGESYFRFALPLRFPVNDIGIAFFVGNELKLGALSTAAGALVAFAGARLLHVGRFSVKPAAELG